MPLQASVTTNKRHHHKVHQKPIADVTIIKGTRVLRNATLDAKAIEPLGCPTD